MNDHLRPVILGIESSCDETAAAVVSGGRVVHSNIVATQHDLHEQYAGVVPEIASRAHLERITPVVREALARAATTWGDIDAIAVGHRPGLIGSLLVGVSAAKTLAWSIGRPLIGVDHVLAHLHAPALNDEPVEYPALGLVVSGGHTSLFQLESAVNVTRLGHTIDDAAGEAFDKAAAILQLGYPGGPIVDALAQSGDESAHRFPTANLGRHSLDFSYSGLKTALLYAVRGVPGHRQTLNDAPLDLSTKQKADFAASFQRAAITPMVRNIQRALDQHPDHRTLVIGGGVSANSRLRAEMTALAARRGVTLRIPAMTYCLDNAAMIAGLAAACWEERRFDDLSLSAAPASAIAR